MGQTVAFEKLNNVRDLGLVPLATGREMKKGILFRADQLFPATPDDREKIKELGITQVIDLRSLAEAAQKPDPEIPGVENIALPVVEDMRPGVTRDDESTTSLLHTLVAGAEADSHFVDNYMGSLYRAFVIDPFSSAQYTTFVDLVIGAAQHDRAILWHCTAGKDRAGFAAVILLKALGAEDDVILQDYLFTNECLVDDVNAMVASLGDALPSWLEPAFRRVFRAEEPFLQAAYDAADKVYGGFDSYLEQALGIDDAKRARLESALCN